MPVWPHKLGKTIMAIGVCGRGGSSPCSGQEDDNMGGNEDQV